MIYELADDAPWLKITTRITNTGGEPLELKRLDAIRADGEFTSGADRDLGLLWVYDSFWGQAYGVAFADVATRLVTGPKNAESRGSIDLELETADAKLTSLAANETREFVRYLFPAANSLDCCALAHELRGKPLVAVDLNVRDADGSVERAEVTLKSGDQIYAHGTTGTDGKLRHGRRPANIRLWSRR